MKDLSSLDHLHNNLLHKGLLFASYRLPEAKDTYTVVQLKNSYTPFTTRLIDMESGFLFSPYKNTSDKPIWIEPDVLFKNGDFLSGNKHWIEHKSHIPVNEIEEPQCIDKNEYVRKIDNLKGEFRDGKLQKAVFTRAFKTNMNGWTRTALFNALIAKYPQAFVYMVNLPGGLSWIGASPETLLTVENDSIETMALAGTRRKSDHLVQWGEKEIEEQHFVEQHVEDVFRSFGLAFRKEGPLTHQTGGEIEHLRTVYQTGNSKISTSELLNKLHPTPAVCGLPVALSGEWLEKNEGYNRSYYSGFLGPINMNGTSNLFVNLRCARIHGDVATIYVGGGITETSDPQLEWAETELKSRTLLNIIESKLKI